MGDLSFRPFHATLFQPTRSDLCQATSRLRHYHLMGEDVQQNIRDQSGTHTHTNTYEPRKKLSYFPCNTGI